MKYVGRVWYWAATIYEQVRYDIRSIRDLRKLAQDLHNEGDLW